MNHFLSITEILLEPITEWNIPNVVTLPRISRDIWLRGASTGLSRAGMATGYPGLLLTPLPARAIRRHRGLVTGGGWRGRGPLPVSHPRPGSQRSSRKEESELCPRLPGHHRVTILGWSWGQRRGCEITDISDLWSPIITRGQVTGPMVSATRGETRLGTISDQCSMFRLGNFCIVWVR